METVSRDLWGLLSLCFFTTWAIGTFYLWLSERRANNGDLEEKTRSWRARDASRKTYALPKLRRR
jgi:hypothetical protein